MGISSAVSSTGVLLHDPSRALTNTAARGATLLALCASDDAHMRYSEGIQPPQPSACSPITTESGAWFG